MRLFSPGQLFLACFFTALGVAGLAFTLQSLNSQPQPANQELAQGGNPESLSDNSYIYQTNNDRTLDEVGMSDFSPDERENIFIYEKFNEAVVNISTEVVAYNWFLEPVPQSGGSGSGSIIDSRGYILTNYHVINKAVKMTVSLADGTQYEGTLVGSDPENDLAVIKFDPKGKSLTTLSFGNSQNLRVGQKVLAIGNPFALDRTMTTGIISALGRPLRTDKGLVIREMIQTDASINPGNSGGPLLNSKGQIIGINTMIFSPSGGSVGIGFAVPVETARRVVPDLIQFGQVQRGWIDLVPIQIFNQLASYARLPVDQGLLISRLYDGGNAQKAGLKGGDSKQGIRYGRSIIYLGGDILVSIDGMPVATLADLYSALESTKPGQRVKVGYLRGQNRAEVEIVLSKRPDDYQWD